MKYDLNEELIFNEEATEPLQNKKQLYYKLYNEIENYYKNYHLNAFNLLNSQDMKEAIIKEIYNNNDDNEIIIFLKQQYFKINKNFYNEYKNYTFEEEQTKNKISINWDYLFQVILNILFFPITILIGSCFTYERYNRKNKRGR